MPRLTKNERRVLLAIPGLWPDGMADDLDLPGIDGEAASHAIQHLMKAKLVWAEAQEGRHPLAPDFSFVELTFEGEELFRDLRRPWIVRAFEREWKWMITFVVAVAGLGLSSWNFLHQVR